MLPSTLHVDVTQLSIAALGAWVMLSLYTTPTPTPKKKKKNTF